MGSVYQRKSDGRWVAAASSGPRGAVVRKVGYADTEAKAYALLDAMGARTPTASERFWSHVDRTGSDCWEWQGFQVRGYGRFSAGSGRPVVASRYAYELANGPIPVGRYVLHRCDNPPCCRPDHLYLGSPADNTADMVRRGRAGWQRAAVAVNETVKPPSREG